MFVQCEGAVIRQAEHRGAREKVNCQDARKLVNMMLIREAEVVIISGLSYPINRPGSVL